MFLKFLLTVVVIVVVWRAFNYWERRNLRRSQVDDLAGPREVEDLTECPVCGAYVPATVAASGVADCEREDCPNKP